MKKIFIFAAALFVIAAGSFFNCVLNASSSDAWEEFKIDVKKACIKLAPSELKNPSIIVDEYGSESYGVAIIQGTQDRAFTTYVCIYDKKTQKAELSGAFDTGKTTKFKK